ncbi:MAG: hypothetical protein LBB55_00725 [Zoogloeaceae bacterium]|jgi:hypothetical protein|nr:hypothetical protein [Zoogloeaceae bacterium]
MRPGLFSHLRRFRIYAGRPEIHARSTRYFYLATGALGMLLLLSVVYILCPPRSPEEKNAAVLQERIDSLEGRLQEGGGSVLLDLEMAHSARRKLEEDVHTLSGDLATVKDDLAYFLRLVPVGTREGEVRLERFALRPDPNSAGLYRFSVLVGYHAGRQTTEFVGRLQFLLVVERGGKTVRLRWPSDQKVAARPEYQVKTRQWERKEGVLRLAPDDVLKKAELSVIQGAQGTRRVAASITF